MHSLEEGPSNLRIEDVVTILVRLLDIHECGEGQPRTGKQAYYNAI
jgi:hypothetical protein